MFTLTSLWGPVPVPEPARRRCPSTRREGRSERRRVSRDAGYRLPAPDPLSRYGNAGYPPGLGVGVGSDSSATRVCGSQPDTNSIQETLMTQFASIVAAQARKALPALSAIPAAALKKPLPFKIVSAAKSRSGDDVLNGTVEYKDVTYRAALFGMGDILSALDGQTPKVDLVLMLSFRKTEQGGVFYARPESEISPKAARAATDESALFGD